MATSTVSAKLRALSERYQDSTDIGCIDELLQAISRLADEEDQRDRTIEASTSDAEPPKKKKKTKRQRREPALMDFSRYGQRHVVLELMYVGWAYQGFARQADSENTIEGHMFAALKRTRLIPNDVDISTLQYSRCGRTDKGVSALGQVVALQLRSNGRPGDPPPPPDAEVDYPAVINRALPDDIRVLGWAPVPNPDFSARFSATWRQYKYFIVHDGGLDLDAMRTASAHFVGTHDFRNFCKVDPSAARSFERRILDFRIEPAGGGGGGGAEGQMYALVVRGTAFLWHQVRCMAAVLLMVGRRLEEPSIVQRLLDIRQTPCKPQYVMAPEQPLLLYACGFEGLDFHRSSKLLDTNLDAVTAMMHQHMIGTALTASIRARLMGNSLDAQLQRQDQLPPVSSNAGVKQQTKGPAHIPLLKRATEPPVEDKLRR